jgi:hypothetical protein
MVVSATSAREVCHVADEKVFSEGKEGGKKRAINRESVWIYPVPSVSSLFFCHVSMILRTFSKPAGLVT